MSTHPTIRILSLMITLVMLPLLTWPAAVVVGVGVAVLYSIHPLLKVSQLMSAIYRLRWLALSLLIIYFWFTPGEPVFGLQSWAIPTTQGILLGTERMLIMLLMVSAVYATLWTTPMQDIRSAIVDLLRLFFVSRAFSRRLALRLTACMDAVPVMLDELSNWRKNENSQVPKKQTAFELLAGILDRAEALQLVSGEGAFTDSMSQPSLIPRIQFFVPVLVFGFLAVLYRVFG